MVVLTIIGMIGMYLILTAVLSTPLTPDTMYVSVNKSSFSINNTLSDSPELLVHVFDQGDVPVGGANIVVWDPSREQAAGGITDGSGRFVFKLTNITLPAGKSEGFIAVRVMQEGYFEYSDNFFVKVRKE
ncbi:carboxypeptidase regulatory-like domain-containing protein [Methanolobus halotolerans]|uniref:Carboxypeptidase regulatory-like domain-containing protein n=2 Tax=Methanolobus halotolerans TaxID=2052935 RepID=A0A4E0PTL8_9EURY|nr:carboxypeptidase regulatory-like domain-containing protein [Methanolobus halotolerans]